MDGRELKKHVVLRFDLSWSRKGVVVRKIRYGRFPISPAQHPREMVRKHQRLIAIG